MYLELNRRRKHVTEIILLYLVCKAPHCRSANENALGSQGERFQYVTSCPYPTVQVNLDSALHRVHDL